MVELKIVLGKYHKNIMIIEDAIANSLVISDVNRMAALLIATETFSNIVEHAVMPFSKNTLFKISSRGASRLEFSYWTTNFSELLTHLEDTKPYFDEKERRYRGYGLRMISNLAIQVEYKKFLFYSKVIYTF